MESSLTNACILKISNFEGPFDLLFHLFEKNRISIYDISLSEITDQYMEYLYSMKELDLDIASEFLVVAATLLHIKSKSLLPDLKKIEGEEEAADPEEELIRRLLEYKKYKKASGILKDKGAEWEKAVYRLPDHMLLTDLGRKLADRVKLKELSFLLPGESGFHNSAADVSTLAAYYTMLMDRLDASIAKNNGTMDKIVQHERISLKDKMRQVTKMLSGKISLLFSDIFPRRKSTRGEIITGFLAILELSRLRKILIEQKKHFTDILIYRYRSSK